MKNKKVIILYFLLIICFFLPNTTLGQTVILSENFSDNHRKWDEDTTETEMCYIKDGKYHIKVNEDTGYYWHWFALPAKINDEKNWLIESTLNLTKMEQEDGFFGMCWGASNPGNMMHFTYYPYSKEVISRIIENGEFYTLTPLIKMDSVIGNKIKFTLLKTDKKYYFLLNGIPFAKCPVLKLKGNKVGFVSSGKSEIEADDLTIKEFESNTPLISQIKSKFPNTEEKLLYYNDKGFPWDGEDQELIPLTKDESVRYRIYTIDDEENIIGFVKEYDSKTNRLIRKFQAKKIDFLSGFFGDILDGECIDYGYNGNITNKKEYFNYENLAFKDFYPKLTFNHFVYDDKERIKFYEEVKDGELKRRIEFDEDGVIENAINTSNIYHFEKNNLGKYDKIIDDDLQSPLLDLPVGETETSASKYTDKGYYINAKKDDAGRNFNIPLDFNKSDFSIGINVDIKGNGSIAILLGNDTKFMNYTCFTISSYREYAIYNIYNGVRTSEPKWIYSDLLRTGINSLNIIKLGNTMVFSINGKIISSVDYFPLSKKTLGFVVTGIGNEAYFSNLIIREINTELPEEFLSFFSKSNEEGFISSGTGFFISNNGHIVTNNHVIENAKEIYIDVTENGVTNTYQAILIKTDAKNDLAILKINKSITVIPYSLNVELEDVGTKVFTLGYPYALTYLGKEIKYTEGSISSKTGYQNDINTYQVSVPIQPGNSGGPLFNTKGNLIGVINSKFRHGDNVSYAIKSSILKSFLDLNPNISKLPTTLKTQELTITSLIKKLENCVVLVKSK